MTVDELRQFLVDLPDDMIVVMSSDSEGNSYSPLAGGSTDYRYLADSTWSGSLVNPDDPDDYDDFFYSDDDDYEDYEDESVPCLVLWPTN